jgi:NADPH2:quinone reductase
MLAMRALLCYSTDAGIRGLRLEETAEPAQQPELVRIRVHAVGLNFADTLFARGGYQIRPKPPFSPGLEVEVEVEVEVEGVAWSRRRLRTRACATVNARSRCSTTANVPT